MATHSAGALLEHPETSESARPAAELIAAFGVDLPAATTTGPRHGARGRRPDAEVDPDAGTALLEGPAPAGLDGVPVPTQRRTPAEFLSSATTRQGVVAAASVTVLGATAAFAAITAGTPPLTSATAEMSGLGQATQPLQPVANPAPAPVAPLATGYDAATKKVDDALPAALHRAEATQIVAQSRVQRARAGTNGPAASDRRGGTAPAPVTVAGSGKGVAALNAALTQRGKPYVWGAAGPSAFDCSGLVMWAFKQVGISLPHSSSAQSRMGTPVSRDQLQPGDLVFFYSPVSHVGIYAGNGQVINATTSGQPVKLSNISGMPFNSARRL